jgi:hypothetical protein
MYISVYVMLSLAPHEYYLGLSNQNMKEAPAFYRRLFIN